MKSWCFYESKIKVQAHSWYILFVKGVFYERRNVHMFLTIKGYLKELGNQKYIENIVLSV